MCLNVFAQFQIQSRNSCDFFLSKGFGCRQIRGRESTQRGACGLMWETKLALTMIWSARLSTCKWAVLFQVHWNNCGLSSSTANTVHHFTSALSRPRRRKQRTYCELPHVPLSHQVMLVLRSDAVTYPLQHTSPQQVSAQLPPNLGQTHSPFKCGSNASACGPATSLISRRERGNG